MLFLGNTWAISTKNAYDTNALMLKDPRFDNKIKHHSNKMLLFEFPQTISVRNGRAFKRKRNSVSFFIEEEETYVFTYGKDNVLFQR